jgi:integrase
MAKRKRGNSEGSIYRMQDGRWRAAVSLGWETDPGTGKKLWKRHIITKSTRHEVAEELKKKLRDQQRGINIDPERKTVAEFLKSWLESVKHDVSPATYVSYEGTVRLHLIPALGAILLTKLQPDHIHRLKEAKLDEVVTKGPGVKKASPNAPVPPRYLSARTVQYCLMVLRMALKQACKLDLVPRNVAMLVDFPKSETAEIRPYTPEEAQRFLEAAKGHRLGALFSAALALALRKGEALGLQWSAIDLERGTLSVRVTLQRIKMPGAKKGQLLLKEPKRSSRRTLNLPQVILSELVEHQRRQEKERQFAGSRWKDTGFVFTSSIGTPLEPRNLERAYSEILAAAKLPRVRIHDLRHTAATLLLTQGVHPRVVMELLGHSQIAVTMNTYSHVVPALRKDAADRMDAILKPAPNPVATRVATNQAPEPVN